MERAFRKVLYINARDICDNIICPLSQSILNITPEENEENLLKRFFNKAKTIEGKPLRLLIPDSLRQIGIIGGDITLWSRKTHKKIIYYFLPKLGKPVGVETSDISIIVTYKLIKPQSSVIIDEKTSFFQVKVEREDSRFQISLRQWYFMRYWPELWCRGKIFNLTSFRRTPDVGAFFLLCYRYKRFNNNILPKFPERLGCEINSLTLSTVYMGERYNLTDKTTESKVLGNNRASIIVHVNKDGDGLFGTLWYIFLTHLGVQDPNAISLLKNMFPQISNNPNFGENMEENLFEEEKSSVCIHVQIRLKSGE